MACVTCGKSFDNSFKAVIRKKKKIYDTIGTEYYIFRQDEKAVWEITRKEYFSRIYERRKPVEYFHISEFKID